MRALALGLMLLAAPLGAAEICTQGDGEWITQACYIDEPNAPLYGHNVLGNTPEWDAVRLDFGPAGQAAQSGKSIKLSYPDHVFEDLAPRIHDIDDDGRPELILIQSSFDRGARILVLNAAGATKASTPYIGTRFRWLAPVGIADLDGLPGLEIAFVDRPHLAKTLRVFRYSGTNELQEIATKQGLTNHRIGEEFISGGIRNCNGRTEMITVDANWQNVMTSYFDTSTLITRVERRFSGQAALSAALRCD